MNIFRRTGYSYYRIGTYFMLSDGAELVITTSYMIDSQGVVYNTTIRPDQMVWDLGQAGDQDPVIQAGVDWLLEQERCLGQ